MKVAGPQILGTGAKFKRVPCQKSCRVNRAIISCIYHQDCIRGKDRGARAPPEIFRFELNSATKVEFCLLKWTAVNGSYSVQVLSIIVRLCTVVLDLLCNLELCEFKERNRIFALPKTTNR